MRRKNGGRKEGKEGGREGAYVLESILLFEQGIDSVQAPRNFDVEVSAEGGGEGVLEEVGELAVLASHFFGVHDLVATGDFETVLLLGWCGGRRRKKERGCIGMFMERQKRKKGWVPVSVLLGFIILWRRATSKQACEKEEKS